MEEIKRQNTSFQTQKELLFVFSLGFFFFQIFTEELGRSQKNVLYKKLVIQLKSTHLVFVNLETKFWILLKLVILYEVKEILE